MTTGALADLPARPGWSWKQLWTAAPRVVEKGHGYLQPLSVYLDLGVVPRAERTDNHNSLGADLDGYLRVLPGDVVFNKLRTWQGGLGVSRYEGIVSPAYYVCRSAPGAEPRFVHYLLRSAPYLAELTRRSKWMPPSQFDIPWDDLRTLPLLLPPLDEQRRIADFLDHQVALLDRAALLADRERILCADRLDAVREHVLLNSTRVTWTPLQRLVDESRPISYGIVQAGPDVADGIPYIKTGDMLNFRPELLSRTSPDIEAAYRRSRVRPGDMVVAMRASIGALIVVPESLPLANLTQGTARIAPRAGIDRDWMYQVLLTRYVQDQFQQRAVGSTFRTLNLWDLRRVPVPLPPPTDIGRLGARVVEEQVSVDRLADSLRRKLALIKERKQSLITAAVTGQFDVASAGSVA